MSAIEYFRYILIGMGYILVLISLIPILRTGWWFVRVFDYPRSQKFWINLIILVVFLFIADFSKTTDIAFVAVIFLNQVYLLAQIWNYTPLASIQMQREESSDRSAIKILIANVFQDNKRTNLCLSLIRELDPDLVLLVETDQAWAEAMKECHDTYPYRISKPLDNTYGMLFFSKLNITKHTVRFLVEPDIPSITVDLMSRDGQRFRLYGLHPKPPVPGESETSTERDAEILIVGKEAKRCDMPVIVAGDLNDVAWSYTTNLFLKVSGLLDPRIGRGFFSTFHANHRLLRWPLDHVFCSTHFYLRDLKRLPHIGSDHFPILIEVSLQQHEIKENEEEKMHADSDDIQVAEEKIQEAK